MESSDVVGFTLFVGFGVWWLIAPDSVRRFYEWFHRGRVVLPRTGAIRCIGAAWIGVVTLVVLSRYSTIEVSIGTKKVLFMFFGGAAISAWGVALWRRWPDAIYDAKGEAGPWLWLSALRIPRTRENCVRFARGCCYFGILMTTAITVAMVAFARP